MDTMKIAIIGGGPTDEHEVSLNSANNVASVLDSQDLIRVTISRDLSSWQIEDELLEPAQALQRLQQTADVALLMLHGPYGEDGTIQGALEAVNIPYTGSGVLASALAIDKYSAGLMVEAAGLHTPATIAATKDSSFDQLELEFPIIIKPRTGGSTVGVSICNDRQQLDRAANDSAYKQLVVQQMIEGREFTCSVVEESNGDIVPLPPSEVISDGLFDYAAKYSDDSSAQEITPADITDDERELIQSAAITAHLTLGCSGITRSDFFLTSSNELFFIEINTCPGMTKRSFIPAEIEAAGLEMGEVLIDQCKLGMKK